MQALFYLWYLYGTQNKLACLKTVLGGMAGDLLSFNIY